jgi:hypothetical protein
MEFKRLQNSEGGEIWPDTSGLQGLWKVTLVSCKQMHTWLGQTRSVLAAVPHSLDKASGVCIFTPRGETALRN